MAALCERVKTDGSDEEKRVLKDWFDAAFVEKLKESDVKGRQVLLDSI